MALVFSVNTNAPALDALQRLTTTSLDLAETQDRINSGLEIRGAQDNAAIFAIAQNLRAEFEGFQAVTTSLDRATSALDIGIAATESIQGLLIEMKERVVAASDEGLDQASRDALQLDFESIRDQINLIVSNAEFNGTNLISTDTTDVISAITSADANNTIAVSHQTLQLTAGTGPVIELSIGSTFATATGAQALITPINDSIANLSDVLTKFGTGAAAIENQRLFTQVLLDTITVGIGNLVDADLARESANLQSLQVQQQLGTQALSIANTAPSIILSLFNG